MQVGVRLVQSSALYYFTWYGRSGSRFYCQTRILRIDPLTRYLTTQTLPAMTTTTTKDSAEALVAFIYNCCDTETMTPEDLANALCEEFKALSVTTRCQAKTKKGTRCKKTAKTDGHCHIHAPSLD